MIESMDKVLILTKKNADTKAKTFTEATLLHEFTERGTI